MLTASRVDDPKAWLEQHAINEVECLVPDLNGILRGKVMPAAKVLASLEGARMFLPISAFIIAVTGRYTGTPPDDVVAYKDPDMRLLPDMATLCRAPGANSSTAYVFADTHHLDGRPWEVSPRHVLKAVIELYRQRGWRAVVAPEMEFYLTAPNPNPEIALTAPIGASGRAETVQHPYGLEALDDYGPVIERIYEHAATASLTLETLTHESGPGQLEINFPHGDPLRLADQVVLFKRLARQAAREHGMHATFMAKPIAEHAGSSTHLHMSVVDEARGNNLFADEDGTDSTAFGHFIGGLQKYLPEITPLMAPYVNSFRRMRPNHSAPANVEWARDNRTCGLRVPDATKNARRVENRLPGADANPYLAIAGSLIAGYLGIEEKIERSPEATGNAYRRASTLPRTMEDALDRLAACRPVRALLGEPFMQIFLRLKEVELDAFQSVVTAWERDHLLLKV